MATDADLRPCLPNEFSLTKIEHSTYRTMIGEVLYLATSTRPDICFAICALARIVRAPTDRHMKMLHRIFRFLSSTTNNGILFRNYTARKGMIAYSDSD